MKGYIVRKNLGASVHVVKLEVVETGSFALGFSVSATRSEITTPSFTTNFSCEVYICECISVVARKSMSA